MDMVPWTESPGDTNTALVLIFTGPEKNDQLKNVKPSKAFLFTLVVRVELAVFWEQFGILDEVVARGCLLASIRRQMGVKFRFGSLDRVLGSSVLKTGFQGGLGVGRPQRVSH